MRTKSILVVAMVVLVVAVFLLTATELCNAVTYEIIDLGTLGVDQYVDAVAINDNDQIVGFASINTVHYKNACLFDSSGNGNNTNLGTLGGAHSWARSNNHFNQIVGYARNASGYMRACIFDATGNSNNIDLGTLGGEESWAYGINDYGQVVGFAVSEDGGTNYRACLFDVSGAGNNIELGTTAGYPSSYAYAINNYGMIVGRSGYDACIFDQSGNGNNIPLGTLGGYQAEAYAVNNSGVIVGYSRDSKGNIHACVFDQTSSMNNVDLGTLGGYESKANAVNDYGHIVGYSLTASRRRRACLFDSSGNGVNIDLNNMIEPESGWELVEAYGINNKGWVVGRGTNPERDWHAFLLTPEPATVAVDIKPGSCPNPLNVKSKGVLPIAILGSENFDVTEIDVLSIQLAGVVPNRSDYEDVATSLVDANECECSTEGPDGYLDLTLKFDTQAIVGAIGEVNDGDEWILELTGSLSDDTLIAGEDCIIIRAGSKQKSRQE